MSDWSSALYFGAVTHTRLKPRRHRLRYAVFSMLFDLDEMPRLGRALRLFSHNRFNLFGFYDRDHGDGTGELRAYVERELHAAGIDLQGGPIRLLCNPRILGYVFNPLSVYFCSRPDGILAAVLYEVNNTFGQRHSYLIPVTPVADRIIRQSCAKEFYVSPFIDMAQTYHFRIDPPAETVTIAIEECDATGTLLEAVFTGRHKPLSDGSLLRAFVRYPLLTLKIVSAIHWEGLRLWRKGLPYHRRPALPAQPVTIVRSSSHPLPEPPHHAPHHV